VAGSDGSCPATAVHGRQAWDRRRAEPRVVAVNSETEAGGRMPLTPPRWTVRSAIEPSVDSAPRGGTSAHRFGTTPSGDRRAPDRRTEGAHTRWAEHRPAGVREGGRPGVRGAARHRRFELNSGGPDPSLSRATSRLGGAFSIDLVFRQASSLPRLVPAARWTRCQGRGRRDRCSVPEGPAVHGWQRHGVDLTRVSPALHAKWLFPVGRQLALHMHTESSTATTIRKLLREDPDRWGD